MVRLRPYWPYWLLRPCIITGEPAVKKRKIVQPKQDKSFIDILKSAVSVFAERFAPNPPLATGVCSSTTLGVSAARKAKLSSQYLGQLCCRICERKEYYCMVSQLCVTMASYIVVPCSWGSYLIVVLRHVCCDIFHNVSTSEQQMYHYMQ